MWGYIESVNIGDTLFRLEEAGENVRLRREGLIVQIACHKTLFPDTPYLLETWEFPASGNVRKTTRAYLKVKPSLNEFYELAREALASITREHERERETE